MVTSPHFLTYMNKALDQFADDERVASAHGYVYPVKQSLPEAFFCQAPIAGGGRLGYGLGHISTRMENICWRNSSEENCLLLLISMALILTQKCL